MKMASFDKVDYIEIETSTNAHLTHFTTFFICSMLGKNQEVIQLHGKMKKKRNKVFDRFRSMER